MFFPDPGYASVAAGDVTLTPLGGTEQGKPMLIDFFCADNLLTLAFQHPDAAKVVDGVELEASVRGVRDLAGNHMDSLQAPFTWRFALSRDAGGGTATLPTVRSRVPYTWHTHRAIRLQCLSYLLAFP